MWRVRMGWTETYSGGRRQDAELTVEGGFDSEREAADLAAAIINKYLRHTYSPLPWFQTFREAA